MSRSTVLLLTMLIPLAALAGCLTSDDETEPGPDGPDGDAGDPGQPGGGNGGNATGPEGNGTSGLASLAGNVTAPVGGNGTDGDGNESGEAEAVVDANLTLVQEGGDGNSSLEATTNETGTYRFDGLEPGEYILRLEAACCEAENVSVTLQAGEKNTVDVELVRLEEDFGPAPEGGTVQGTSAGFFVLTLGALGSERASFDVNNGSHTQIELIPELSDPEAEDGSSYSLRVYLPDEEEEDYDATNGEPIVVDSVMEGTYEITIWPASVFGSFDYSIEWCVYTEVHCSD